MNIHIVAAGHFIILVLIVASIIIAPIWTGIVLAIVLGFFLTIVFSYILAISFLEIFK